MGEVSGNLIGGKWVVAGLKKPPGSTTRKLGQARFDWPALTP